MVPDDLLLPAWRSNPYPLYAALRLAAGAHWGAKLNAWVITRHVDVAAALRDPRFSSRRGTAPFAAVPPELQDKVGLLKQSLKQWVLFRDPPEHTRLRVLLNKAFAPGLIEAMRPKIRRLVEELLAEAMKGGALEVVSELAYPLPAIVIAELLGIPREDRDRFKRWSDDLASLLTPGLDQAAHTGQALASWQEMDAYLQSLIADRRKAPRDDLLSVLLASEEKGVLLSEDEIRSTLSLLLFAGHETTTNLIATGVLTMLRHPEALKELRQHPELVPAAVEELLRYEAPVQLVMRQLIDDVELSGQTLHKGQRVILLVASANRDPDQFPDPDHFLIRRRDGRHLAFGLGLHFCLGAALARAEAQTALEILLKRWPRLRLAEQSLVWRDSLAFRCPQQLLLLT